MFAALRTVRHASRDSEASHDPVQANAMHNPTRALHATRNITRARREAVVASAESTSRSHGGGASAPTARLMSVTIRCLADIAKDNAAGVSSSSSSSDMMSLVCAWTQLATSAVLAARLAEAARTTVRPDGEEEAALVASRAVRVRCLLYRALTQCPIVFTATAPDARLLARVLTSARLQALLAHAGDRLHGQPVVYDAPTRPRRLPAKRRRSADAPYDRDEDDERRKPLLSATPTTLTTPTPVAKRGFAFRVRVTEPPPPQQQQQPSSSADIEKAPTAWVAAQAPSDEATGPARREAPRRLVQTSLAAFTGVEVAAASQRTANAQTDHHSHMHHNNGHHHAGSDSTGPSAAAAAVLRELRGHALHHRGGAEVNAYGYPQAQPGPAPPPIAPAPWLQKRDDSSLTSYFANGVPAPTVSNPIASYGSTNSRKAPPYTAGNGDTQANAGTNTTANSSAPSGFVTAGEQLASDIRSGRANPASASLLSHRSPALGLRRTGFQAPFQQQPQQQQQPASPPSADSGDASLSVNKVLKAVAAPKQANAGGGGGDDDEDGGSYPASLLLPDGSVPPILLPLDPKLVTQVAMEILEDGAGAKKIGWDDIAGLQHAKGSVEEAIVWPLRRPDLFVGLRDPPRGLLLFGPPGTGKTMIARAIANRTECTFLNISSSSLMSKWVGDGEKLVRCLFAVATVKQPSVIFIDEIDSLLSMRGEGEMDAVRRVKTEFLVQLDGVATDQGDRVLLIGATNRPDELDEAARRRMEKRLYIPLPDKAARRQLIQRLLFTLEQGVKAKVAAVAAAQQSPDDSDETGHRDGHPTVRPSPDRKVHALTDDDLDHLADVTHGYSGADLKQLCREASMGPLREMSMHQLSEVSVGDLRAIDRRDFRHALKRLKPSVGASEVVRYEEWNKQYGSFADNSDGDEDMTDSDASPTK